MVVVVWCGDGGTGGGGGPFYNLTGLCEGIGCVEVCRARRMRMGQERKSGNAGRGLLVMSGMGQQLSDEGNTKERTSLPPTATGRTSALTWRRSPDLHRSHTHTHTHTHTHHHSLLLRLPPIHSRLPNVAPAPPALTIFTCCEFRSASLKTATVLMPSFFAVRITRHAISPLFATSTLSSSGASLDAMRARGRIRELRAKSDIMWARIS